MTARPSGSPQQPHIAPWTDRDAAAATVLAINPGSSSLKAVLRSPAVALTAGIERLGTDQARWTATGPSRKPDSEPFAGDLPAAVAHLAELLSDRGVQPDAVAHRIVHGGPSYDRATVVTDTVRGSLDALVAWAPLHLPGNLASLDAARKAWPDAVHVACFDTAFHHSMPDEARRLPLPAQADQLGMRRYGFHGLSVQSIIDAVPDLGGAVIAHLGSGCSVTAVSDGRSLHTSMSLTPTGGVMSATRSGDLDPEIPLLLLDQPGATADTVRDLLDQESGLAGIAHGLHDVRDLLAARHHDPAAELALRVFTRNVAMAIAAAATTLPRWDTLVFTGGIGEHAPAVCGEICRRLTSLRPQLSVRGVPTGDPAAKAHTGAAAGMRTLTTTGLRVLITQADEAAVMDRQTRALLAAGTEPPGQRPTGRR
jgi:acetate kinase